MPSTPPPPTGQRLRILCLHGYTQNKDVFRSRIAVIRKDLKNTADFEFISAPHVVRPEDVPAAVLKTADGAVPSPSDDGPRSWWNPAETPSGLDESLARVTEVWAAADPPFDGLFGFSQGATMAALVLPRLQPPPRFTVHCSGFYPIDASQGALLAVLPAVPSLHVMGRGDAWVTPARSEALRGTFKDPETLVHDGGHFVPTSANHRQVFRDFLGKFVRSH